MDYNGSVMKRVALFLIVAGAAVAMVACQGAVGKTGEPGPKGEPGDSAPPAPPVNLAPFVTTPIEPVMLMDEGNPDTIDLDTHFHDPEGEGLTFAVSTAPVGIVEATLEGSDLTIAPLAAGGAEVTVTATDPKGAHGTAIIRVAVSSEGIMYVGELDKSVALTPGQQHIISGAEIEGSFEEDEGETLTFSVSTSDPSVALVDKADDNMVTITALDAVGSSADVTITAMDDEGDTAPFTITVTVVASLAPQRSDMTPAPVSLTVGDDPHVIPDVSMYFTDPAGDDLMYNPESDDPTVVNASATDSMVTITVVGAGTATVTITATNSRDLSATQMVEVTVAAAPPAMPEVSDDIEDVLFQNPDAAVQTIMLSDHFTGAMLEYGVTSTSRSVATATEAGGVLTVTPVGAGTTEVTVTARNDSGMVSDTFVVNVLPAATMNQPPMLKDGVTLAFKGLVGDVKNIELNEYFVDSDGNSALISYDTEVVSEDPTTDPTAPAKPNVIAVRGAGGWYVTGTSSPPGDQADCVVTGTIATDGTGSVAIPDGNDLGEDLLGICYQEAGTARIEVVAIDSLGARSNPVTVMVTVGANNVPTVVTEDDQAGIIADASTSRLKVGDTRKVINNRKIEEYFADNDFPPTTAREPGRGSDTLTFEVKSYAGTVAATALYGTDGNAADDAPEPLAPDKAQISATISPGMWSGDRNSKFTLTLMGERGSTATTPANETVAIIATDEFGKSVAKVFEVRVNHRPQPYGDQATEADRTTLEKYKGFMDMDASANASTLSLIAVNAGYFSDKDGDTISSCAFRTSEHTVAADDRTADVSITGGTTLSVDPKNIGTMHIDVWCNDGIEDSEPARVMVEVDRGASIHN